MSRLLCKLTVTNIWHTCTHTLTHTCSVQPSHILVIFFVCLLNGFMTTDSWRVLECVCSAPGQVDTWVITVFDHKRADVPEMNSATFSFRFFFFKFDSGVKRVNPCAFSIFPHSF